MSNVLEAVVNLSKMCIGCGILALPYASAQAGLLLSPLLMGLVAVLNGVSCCMLMRARRAVDITRTPSNISCTYSKLAYAAIGLPGVVLVDISLIGTLVGVCVTYLINFGLLTEGWLGLSMPALICIFAITVYPLCCVKNINGLAGVALCGIGFLFISVFVILIYGYERFGFPNDKGWRDMALWPGSSNDVFNYIGVATFCIDICTPIFPIEESMKKRSDIFYALVYSLLFVWTTYAIFGDLGSVLYSNHVGFALANNILLSLPPNSVIGFTVKFVLAMVCLLTYPLTIMPAAQMIEQMLESNFPSLTIQYLHSEYATISDDYVPIITVFSERLQPIDSPARSSSELSIYSKQAASVSFSSPKRSENTPSRFSPSPTPASYFSIDEEIGNKCDDTSTCYCTENETNNTSSVIMRCITRFFLVLCTVICALKVPCFSTVIAFLGSCTVSVLTYIMPPLLHAKLVTEPLNSGNLSKPVCPLFGGEYITPHLQLVLDWLFFSLGVIFCLFSTAQSGYAIFMQLSGLSTCSTSLS